MRRPIEALLHRIGARPTQEFRILHKQFLLRVVDLEALSIEADIPRFLGQFAGVLIMFSLVLLVGTLMFPSPPILAWHIELSRVSDMLLVIGLCSVVMWDTTFPDRRDVMVLAPLPVSPRTILCAKVAASSTILAIAILALNCGSGLALSLIFGTPHGGALGLARYFLAYWFTMFVASGFLFGAVLTLQGTAALFLSRRLFLRVSAILQLAAFAVLLGARFLEPVLTLHEEFIAPANHLALALSPAYWFFGLFNQLNGTLTPDLLWLAHRAWMSLGLAVFGAAASLLLCYVRTMKKIVEDPDLVPGTGGVRSASHPGRSLQATIVSFCLRSIIRSRQHRLVLAFYWSLVFAVALSWLRHVLVNPPETLSLDFMLSTFVMMCFAVFGLRAVFSLPISLHANWVLRITQIRPTRDYIAATRSCLFIFGVTPIWIISAVLSLHFRPGQWTAEHLLFLALFGWIFIEVSLIRFDKIPFTCSFLPGKTNIQVVFWGFAFFLCMLSFLLGTFEMDSFVSPARCCTLILGSAGTIAALFAYNRIHAQSAVLYYEEVAPEVMTRLGLLYIPPA